MLNPIPDRYDMAHYAQTHFYRTGAAVEVGVFEGAFAKHNLKHWQGQYLMVDTWQHRDDGTTDKNDKDNNYWKSVEDKARMNTGFAGDRRTMIKGYSVEVADDQPNLLFDWVFLDAGHDYDSIKADLEAWWPKVRKGGLFSGDDYGLCVDDARLYPLTADRFERKIGGVARAFNWGTARALHEFCDKYKVQLNITWLNDFANPAWYIIKSA